MQFLWWGAVHRGEGGWRGHAVRIVLGAVCPAQARVACAPVASADQGIDSYSPLCWLRPPSSPQVIGYRTARRLGSGYKHRVGGPMCPSHDALSRAACDPVIGASVLATTLESIVSCGANHHWGVARFTTAFSVVYARQVQASVHCPSRGQHGDMLANGQSSYYVGTFMRIRPSVPPWGDPGGCSNVAMSRVEPIITGALFGLRLRSL